MTHPFETGLNASSANFAALTPASFLARAASGLGALTAVIDGDRRITYAELYARCCRLASALAERGIGRLDTVAVLAANTPEMIEAHFAVPMLGAVLNPLNVRLDPAAIAFCLDHGEAKVLIVDGDFAEVAAQALALLDRRILIVEAAAPGKVEAPASGRTGTLTDAVDYEAFLATGDLAFAWPGPCDEWQSLCLLYTSGTTGDPKGVVYSHRGAYLQALGNAVTFGVGQGSIYLWTLPMFHCNGWSYPWAVVAAGGTQVCLRKADPAVIFRLIAEHRVTHLCGAPILLSMLVNAPASQRVPFSHTIRCATGGAAPSSTVLRAMEAAGFEVVQLYGATETYGPAAACLPQPRWSDLLAEERYGQLSRQGIALTTVEDLCVLDPATSARVPRDGLTVGEIAVRGNTVMKGYLKNPGATHATLRDGWYLSGDLAVWHPDGAVEIKDRAKDIIISGGENISSLEVEEVLTRHPAIQFAAVVAKPDPLWGESPCAFIELKSDASAVTEDEIVAFCRTRLARFKVPKSVVFGELPKTATGKIQKFALRDRVPR